MSARLFSLCASSVFWALSLVMTAGHAATPEAPYLTFGVVPQQSATKLASQWGPLLAHVEAVTGVTLRFKTAPNIPEFEKRLTNGEYDFAYMNPYHYTVFSRAPGYQAIAHERDKKLVGIIVTRKDAPYRNIEELAGSTLAFPAPAAFAATVLPLAEFARRDIAITPKYVASHDSVYHNVAKGLYPAGGGVVRTFNAMPAEIADSLRVLWKTPGYTPHALAVHPRVDAVLVKKVQAAFVALQQDAAGRALLEPLEMSGWQEAVDSEWDDVRALNINLLTP